MKFQRKRSAQQEAADTLFLSFVFAVLAFGVLAGMALMRAAEWGMSP